MNKYIHYLNRLNEMDEKEMNLKMDKKRFKIITCQLFCSFVDMFSKDEMIHHVVLELLHQTLFLKN